MTGKGFVKGLTDPTFLTVYRLVVSGAIVIGLPVATFMADRMVKSYDEGRAETRVALKEIYDKIVFIRDQQVSDGKDIDENRRDIERLERRMDSLSDKPRPIPQSLKPGDYKP